MKNPIARGMSRATALTRAGKLNEATALIQSLLQPTAAPGGHEVEPHEGVIEGTFTRLDGTGSAPKAPKPGTATRRARKGLGDTLRDLSRGGMPRNGMPVTPPKGLPEGAQFLSLTHNGAQGSRDYRLYVPAVRPEGPVPLVVMLHGCTQSPEDFANGTGMNDLAEEFGCLIAWPSQPQGANMNRCWNWFRPEDQSRGLGEPALIAGLVGDVLRGHDTDPARVYVAGLSAGGAAAAIMGATYPEVFAAVGVHSGLPVGAARDMPSAFAAMRGGAPGAAVRGAAPAIVFHGLADTTVHPGNGTAVITQALAGRSATKSVRLDGVSDGGRSYRLTRHHHSDGRTMAEHWEIDDVGHAWSGGRPSGSYTDPQGPDASREMIRFFLQHRQG